MNDKKQKIIRYILEHIESEDKKYVEKAVQSFEVSKSTVYNYVKELEQDGVIVKNKPGFSYKLVRNPFYFKYDITPGMSEDRIFDRDIEPVLKEVGKEALTIWRYAFCEMMNNVLEHSKAESVYVKITKNALNTRILIDDNGIGIFKNIQNFMKSEKNEEITLEECASLLLAGKFTTAKENHSGEGIFFTSLVMDNFFIASDGHYFFRDSFSSKMKPDDCFSGGTCVIMSLENNSRKKLRKVFDMFSDTEEGFFRTQIPMVHMFPSGFPVSRSEARRLCEMIKSFKEVTLDFRDVDDIGQAFAHELFVLWQKRNPNIKLTVINANDNVDFMIKRAIRTAENQAQ